MSLAQKAVSGAAWNIVASLGARVVGVVATLIVTRFIAPGEYGEVIGAAILVQTCIAISHLGLLQYLAVKHKAGPDVVFHITFYSVLVCSIALGAALLLRDRLGAAFGLHDLGAYLPWLCIAGMMDRLSSIPERLLYRNLRFRFVALTRAAGELTFSVGAMLLAGFGKGAMAIVIATLLRSGLRSVIFIAAVDVRTWLRPHAIRWRTTREIFTFGLPLSVSNVAGVMSTRCDNFITSHYFGAAVMGAYNLAYGLSEMPVTQVAEQVGDVLLPSFAQMAPEERRKTLGRSMALLGIIVFPLAVGLAAVSGTLARAFFDAKWAHVGPMLAMLSVLSITRPVIYIVVSYLQASSRVFAVSTIEVTKLFLLFAMMVFAAPYGVMAVCGAVGAAFAFQALAGLWVVTRDGLSLGATLLRLARPLLSTLPMAAAVLGVRWVLAAIGLRSAQLGLIIEIIVGAVVYVPSALLIAGDTARDLLSLIRKRKHAPEPDELPSEEIPAA
jgi:PST family polysaccharide transporter